MLPFPGIQGIEKDIFSIPDNNIDWEAPIPIFKADVFIFMEYSITLV
jgi:hypothetical protein